jgi:hypothetical protein
MCLGTARLNELESVSKWIINKETPDAGNFLVRTRCVPRSAAPGGKGVQVINIKRDMGLPGGAEFSLDAQMHLRSAEIKPGAAACREFHRLGNLAQAEDVAVKAARLIFEALRHRELYVVQAKDAHLGISR